MKAALVLALAMSAPTGDTTTSSFNDLFDEAVKSKKPLCVWIGYKCPSSAGQVPGMLHHHAGNSWRDVSSPAVVVLVPTDDGRMLRAEVVSAEKCCASELRAAVERELSRRQSMMTAPSPTLNHIRGWASSRDGACST